MKLKVLILLIAVALFVVPFFWLKPGEMDLGGDSNRLYFYDPIRFIQSTGLYAMVTGNKGGVEPNYYYIPYVATLASLRYFVSTTTVIAIINGLKLSLSFFSITLIVNAMLKDIVVESSGKPRYIAGMIAGIFYISAFGSVNMAQFWDRALTSHNQVFLNPLFFYLFYRFLWNHKYIYLWVAILLSIIFAPNFGLTSAPPFFAFYPLAAVFLLLWTKLFCKKPIPWIGLICGAALFLGAQAFQYVGQTVNLFDRGSFAYTRVFDAKLIAHEGVSYFSALKDQGKASLNILLPSFDSRYIVLSLFAPLVIFISFIISGQCKRNVLLLSIFSLLTLFLSTANITNIGYSFYRNLFYLPGFSMFRNYYTQWLYSYIFYISLLFGFSLFTITRRLKVRYTILLGIVGIVCTVLPGYILFSGYLINHAIIRGSKKVTSVFTMDPRYEEVLAFIRTLPDEGKILMLPLSDSFRQVVIGKNGGAYEGPSTLLHLTNKYSFVGYQDFYPYSEDIMKYAREKNYDRLLRILKILNIRYVLFNDDPKAYEENFIPGPFGYMMTSLPKTQGGYREFIAHFPLHLLHENGPYEIYELESTTTTPTIFAPDNVYLSNELTFDNPMSNVFIFNTTCEDKALAVLCKGRYRKPTIALSSKMVSPVEYIVHVHVDEPFDGLLLVMQHTYHHGWKVMIGKLFLPEAFHLPVNGYANGWFIGSEYLQKRQDIDITIMLDTQKYFLYGIALSAVSVTILLFLCWRSVSIIKHE